MEVIGYITRRRSCGKNLAFADIKVDDATEKGDGLSRATDSDGSVDVISVKFVRHSDESAWNRDFGDFGAGDVGMGAMDMGPDPADMG